MTRKIIGTATTDAQGVARLPYTIQGIGQIRVTAENGTLVSNTYNIIDAYFYNYYDGLILGSNMTKTVDDTGILFTCSSGTSSVALRKKGASNNYNYVTPFNVEFDIISFDTESNPNVQCYDQTTTINRTFSQIGITGPCHLKIEYNTDGTKYYVDGEKTAELSSHCTNASRVYLNQITSLKISEPMIYNSDLSNVTDRVLTTLTLTGNHSSVDYGGSVTLTVTARDQYNQTMAGETIGIVNNTTSSTITTVTTNSNGNATYTFTPSATGTYSLKASKGNVDSSNLSLTVVPVLASVSLATSKSRMTTEETATLTVTALDNDGNGMNGASVSIYNGDDVLTTVTTGNGGNATYTFSPSTAGTYSLTAVSGSFESSTVSVAVVTPAPVLTSLTLSSNKSSMSVGESATLTVSAKDQYNTGMSGVNVDIYNGSTKLATVSTSSNGTKTYAFTPASDGSYTLRAVCGSLQSGTVSVTVLPVVDSITLTSSASVIQSGGTATLTVTASGNSTGVEGVEVSIYEDGALLDTVTTGSGGTATYSYLGTGVGDTVFYATDGTISSSNITIEDCWNIKLSEATISNSSGTKISSIGLDSVHNVQNDNFIFEFDGYGNGTLSIGGASNWSSSSANYRLTIGYADNKNYWSVRTTSTNEGYGSSASTSTWYKYRIEREGTTVRYYVDDTLIQTKTSVSFLTSYSTWSIYSIIWGSATQKYKNIKLKPL